VPFLKVGFAVIQLHAGEFAPKDLHEEVAVAAGRLEET
jgi:hypothetical protein